MDFKKSGLIDAAQSNDTFTENGALTNSTSGSGLLDFFFTAGAMRTADDQRIIQKFRKALGDNPLLAMKTLFWLRDIRSGAGERRVFRVICTWLANENPEYLQKNLVHVANFGRFDDLVHIYSNTTTKRIKDEIIKILYSSLLDRNALCAKWMPRKGRVATALRKDIASYMENGQRLTPKIYRIWISSLSSTVEQQMCSKKWDEINFNTTPSVALSRYKKAFHKHSSERFTAWVESLKKNDGTAKINAGAVYPYDIIHSLNNSSYAAEKNMCNEQWKALPNYLADSTVKFLPVVDVSGSMDCPAGKNSSVTCMDVAISLGLYISERNQSIFKDAFVTFSSNPTMEYIKGSNLQSRYDQLARAHWSMSTNIIGVFELLLNAAKRNLLTQDDMPTTILILSDMEFDNCAGGPYDSIRNTTAYNKLGQMYADSGYFIPNIVFWNIQSRQENVPVKVNDIGVALVSGFSPSILTSLLKGTLNPMQIFLNTIEKEIYSVITI